MLESFSSKAVTLIDQAKEIAFQEKETSIEKSFLVGSEHLLLAMYLQPDTICHFLLEEQGITYDDLLKKKNSITIIHKEEHPSITFTKEFQEIVLNATIVAEKARSEYVFDEHLFYSMLDYPDATCNTIIEKLGINIDNLKKDIEDIFNFNESTSILYQMATEEPSHLLKKITNSKFIHPYIERSDYLERMLYILGKRQKNNPLLIGSAGVGKTALVEGVSKYVKENIYQLDLGCLVAGTKYRGELEDKIVKAIHKVEEENAILFIDEIHNIVGSGSSEGSLDIANLLKPYLTGGKVKIIGATTLQEYYRYIKNDQALSRRFQTIFIDEPNKAETYNILKGISYVYEDYYNTKIDKSLLKNIINYTSVHMPDKHFPDKAIDVLDESLSRYKLLKKPLPEIVKKTIQDNIGFYMISESKLKNVKLNFNKLKPFYARKLISTKKYNNIGVIYLQNAEYLKQLESDLEKVFHYKNEMKLELDLEIYSTQESLHDLIGSSKGYVGYSQGGLLYNHILYYPINIVVLKNFEKASSFIKSFFKNLFLKSSVTDSQNRLISLTNTLFVILNYKKEASVGFIENNASVKNDLAEIII